MYQQAEPAALGVLRDGNFHARPALRNAHAAARHRRFPRRGHWPVICRPFARDESSPCPHCARP